jgi:hypothetical protein
VLVDGEVFAEAWVVAYVCAYTEGLSEWTRWHFLLSSCWLFRRVVLDIRMFFMFVQLERRLLVE